MRITDQDILDTLDVLGCATSKDIRRHLGACAKRDGSIIDYKMRMLEKYHLVTLLGVVREGEQEYLRWRLTA